MQQYFAAQPAGCELIAFKRRLGMNFVFYLCAAAKAISHTSATILELLVLRNSKFPSKNSNFYTKIKKAKNRPAIFKPFMFT
ncbi:MAG: hypothetical protein MR782_04715 [Campylobacter sp.]|nr:hypothetical protein [Campylobacter sp.]